MTDLFSKLRHFVVVYSPRIRRSAIKFFLGAVTGATVVAAFATPAYATSVTTVSFTGTSQVAHSSSTRTVNFTPTTTLVNNSTISFTFPINFTFPAPLTVTLGAEFRTEKCLDCSPAPSGSDHHDESSIHHHAFQFDKDAVSGWLTRGTPR